MLEIVERILAAVIILALLTLLIILAFPVPPRQPAGPTTAQRPVETQEEPARPAPRTETTRKDPPAPKPAPPQEAPAKETRPDTKIETDGSGGADRTAENRSEQANRPAESSDPPRRRSLSAPLRDSAASRKVCPDDVCRKRVRRVDVRDCSDVRCAKPLPAPVAKGCSDRDCECGGCCPGARRRYVRPYWAQPRRYAAHEYDPDWYDEREVIPGPPPGVCPEG